MTTEEDLPRYEAVTQGMKISVTPAFLEDESKPASNR